CFLHCAVVDLGFVPVPCTGPVIDPATAIGCLVDWHSQYPSCFLLLLFPQKGAPEVGAPKIGCPNINAPQVGAPKGSDREDSTYDIGAPKISGSKIGAPEIGACKVSAPEIGACEIGACEIGAPEIGACEIGAPKVGIPKGPACRDRLLHGVCERFRRALPYDTAVDMRDSHFSLTPFVLVARIQTRAIDVKQKMTVAKKIGY